MICPYFRFEREYSSYVDHRFGQFFFFTFGHFFGYPKKKKRNMYFLNNYSVIYYFLVYIQTMCLALCVHTRKNLLWEVYIKCTFNCIHVLVFFKRREQMILPLQIITWIIWNNPIVARKTRYIELSNKPRLKGTIMVDIKIMKQ